MKIKKIQQSAGYIGSIVDSLENESQIDALSARQGKVLNNLIEENTEKINDAKAAINTLENEKLNKTGGTITGDLTVNTTFTFDGISVGDSDRTRPVWFAVSEENPGEPVYNTKFEYNPVSNDLKVGSVNGLKTSQTAVFKSYESKSLNDLPSLGTGLFLCRYGCTNTPMNSGVENVHWYVTQNVWGAGTYCTQLASSVHGDVRYWHRTQVGGTWTQWRPLTDFEVLYDNASGTNGTVTLSRSASNYGAIKVYYKRSGAYNLSQEIEYPDGKQMKIQEVGAQYLYIATLAFSGATVTTNNYSRQINIIDGSQTTYNTNAFYITKIVGYF